MMPLGTEHPAPQRRGLRLRGQLFHAKARTGTPRRHLINILARIAGRARHQM